MTTGPDLLRQMCRVPEPQGTDEELVREALKSFRRIALMFDGGGLQYACTLSKAALEAFERLADLQPGLFQQ